MTYWLSVQYAHDGNVPDTGPDGTDPPPTPVPPVTPVPLYFAYAWDATDVWTDITSIVFDNDDGTTFTVNRGPSPNILADPLYLCAAVFDVNDCPVINGYLEVHFTFSSALSLLDLNGQILIFYHINADPMDAVDPATSGWNAYTTPYLTDLGGGLFRASLTSGSAFPISAGVISAFASSVPAAIGLGSFYDPGGEYDIVRIEFNFAPVLP